MTIRLATRHDVPALMALESRYYIGNLDPSERADGFISVLHSRDWFEAAVDDGGVHVALDDDGNLVGFIGMTAPPERDAPTTPPIVRAMLDLAQTEVLDGSTIAEQRYGIRGPVLIDREARGQGVYSAFNDVIRQAYRGRYDIAVLFVAADNPRSLHTTTTKLGATPLATFEVEGKEYHFLAFEL